MFRQLPKIRTLSDIKAIEKTDVNKRISVQNTYEVLQQSAKLFSDQHAIRFIPNGTAAETPYDLSYRSLFEKVTQAANLFRALGVEARETVSYILPNVPQAHFCIWGGEAAGVASAVNPFLESQTIASILRETDCKILIVPSCGEIWEKVQSILDQVPSLQCVLGVDLGQYGLPSTTSTSHVGYSASAIQMLDFDKELAKQPKDNLIFNRIISRDEVAAYFHTGGTTGNPKIAMHTHFNQVCNAWMISTLCVDHQQPDPDIILSGLPLFHVNAVMVTGLGAFMRGATVVMAGINGYRTPDVIPSFWSLVNKYKATTFSCVPTILTALLSSGVPKADIGSLRYALCGAAPLSLKTFTDFQELTNIKILEGYGLTESTCVASLNPQFGEKKLGSVGLPVPYQQTKLVQLDEQGNFIKNCSRGEVGTLYIKGPHVFAGYRNKKGNAVTFDDDGWLNTGDLARIDDEGYIWLTGRAKDLIIRGGHNIDPAIIEEALSRHPAVEMVAAVGQPNTYAGELPCAYVTVNMPTNAADILDFGKKVISERAAIPVFIEILNTMPITAVGKIFKPDLKDRATVKAFEAVLAEANIAADVSIPKGQTQAVLIEIKAPAPKDEIDNALRGFTIPFTIVEHKTLTCKRAV